MSVSIDIQHDFGGFEVNTSFVAGPGVTALFGRSGSGKTTVINAVAGLFTPTRGRIALNDRLLFDSSQNINIAAHKRHVGYVFQDARLFPHMDVSRNLTYAQRFHRRPPLPLSEVVEMLGIGPLLSRHPSALSGGEKQRVAIGRALLSAPDILLMDEPLAALDAGRKDEILPYLERLRDHAGLPILYVSHSMTEVARLANTLVLLDNGRVRRAGPLADLLSDPDLGPAIGLREAGSVLPAHVIAHHADGLTELSSAGARLLIPRIDAQPGQILRIRIHAHELMLSLTRPTDISALNILPAVVESLRLGEGPGAMVRLTCGDQNLLARITKRSAMAMNLAPGMACYAIVKSVSVAQGNVGTAYSTA